MLKKLLGLVFNRWLLAAVLLLAVLGVVWLIGPLVAVGDVRPLDGVRARWLTTAAIVLGVAALVAWRAWRARHGNAQVVAQLVAAPAGPDPHAESADLALVRGRFEGALALLRQARFGVAAGASGGAVAAGGAAGAWRKLNDRFSGRYLYQLPWYLIIGAPGSGKTTALRNAGLQFPLAGKMGEQAVRGVGGTRACDWWFTDRAVLIDTAGRFTTQDSDPANDQATWAGFLALLKKSRPRQPVNGVLVTVAVPDLLAKSAAERQQHAQTVRARVQELHQVLGIRLPIYLLVTKCDLMAGFTETFEALGKAVRTAPWGFTFALPAAGAPPALQQAMQQEMKALQTRLDQGLVDRLQAEADPPRRERIYGFPNQFASLHAPVQEFVEQVFAPSPFEAEPMLRGVYFVSGTQEGTPIDRVLGAVARRYRLEQAMLPSQRASGRSYFLEQVLSNVVLTEQGLAGTRRGWERRRQAFAVGAYAMLSLLACAALAAWWVSWHGNTRYIEAVAKRVEVARSQLQQTPNHANAELRPLLPALQATQALARASADEGAAVPWSLGFGLYQGRRLDAAAQLSYQQMLRDAMLPRLALRFENQLRVPGQPEAHYEALKAYLMLYDLPHFDAAALKAQIEADWQLTQDRSLSNEQRQALANHLDALLAQGPAVSPLPKDQALVDTTRNRLAAVPLPQRVYSRLRQRGLGEGFAEFTVVKAGGSSAPLVFTRASGQPLTRGVPGLFTYKGYHEGFQAVVGDATRQLADEQGWVLGVAGSDTRGAQTLLAPGKLTDDVRRLYLTEYRDTWKAFIADVRMLPAAGVTQALERTRFLAAPDTPLLPLLKAMSRETTLLASSGPGGALQDSARGTVDAVKGKVFDKIGVAKPNLGTPGERIESIVDDEFTALRRQVTAPEGGKAPVESVLARLGELQVLLTATDTVLKGGGAPPPSPLPNQMRADAANAPEPLRALLDTLGAAAGRGVASQLRETLSRDVRSQVGEFCQQAAAGRYPFDASAAREVTPADFAALFGPGGKFELMQQKLAPYIDTSTRPWSFRPIEGASMGSDAGTLPQFQRAATIRETFFQGGTGPATQLVFKPVEMDQGLKEFSLDVDGQPVRYDHGPQIPQPVRWPGPRGSGVVRVAVQPAGGTGMLNDGPWALFRLFERVDLQPGSAPEKFRATFNIDGRKAVFDITAGSVRNPLRLPELRSFACPMGL